MKPYHKLLSSFGNENSQEELVSKHSAIFQKPGLKICLAAYNDREVLSELSKETFRQTYPGEFSEKDLELMFNVEKLTLELFAENKFFFIAKDVHRTIGYAKVEFENNIAYLSKLYLLSEAQGKGVGKTLLKFCCEEIIKRRPKRECEWNASVIRLDVWENNHKAIKYYENLGFQKGDKHELHFNEKVFYDYRMEHVTEKLLDQLRESDSAVKGSEYSSPVPFN